MNSGNFFKWLDEQLIPALEEPSLIIMDNAPYHSSLVNIIFQKFDLAFLFMFSSCIDKLKFFILDGNGAKFK